MLKDPASPWVILERFAASLHTWSHALLSMCGACREEMVLGEWSTLVSLVKPLLRRLGSVLFSCNCELHLGSGFGNYFISFKCYCFFSIQRYWKRSLLLSWMLMCWPNTGEIDCSCWMRVWRTWQQHSMQNIHHQPLKAFSTQPTVSFPLSSSASLMPRTIAHSVFISAIINAISSFLLLPYSAMDRNLASTLFSPGHGLSSHVLNFG